ncbi:MAG TPA: nitroreductase family deazaflavin-dependent oxidoreductase [Streptosporangiaceae bacterium]|nr:nitroreductase family deazaflavin-dependent oxidoreductase [Streptosporangiaceae bacterium]
MAKTYRLTAFGRFGNLVTAGMIKAGLGPAGLHLLTVRGRTTGLPRTTPVNVIEHDGRRWLVAPYGNVGWVRNARATGRVELRRGRTVQQASVREAAPGEAAPVLRSYLSRLKLVVGPYFDVAPTGNDAAFAAEAPRHPVFVITGA